MPPASSSSRSSRPARSAASPLGSSLRACILGLAVLAVGFAGGVGFDIVRSKSFAAPFLAPEPSLATSTDSVQPAAPGQPAVAEATAADAEPGPLSAAASEAEPTRPISPSASASAPALTNPDPYSTPAPTPTPTVGEILTRLSPNDSPRSIHKVTVAEPLVALTFDDGPSPTKTRRLMQFLESRGTPATFFFIGKQVEQYPEVARDAVRRGFELGNHTYSHLDLAHTAAEKARLDIESCQKAFAKAGIPAPELVRFPYGNSTPSLRRYCQSIPLAMIAWEVDTRDWEPNATADLVYQRVAESLAPGAIILMHERPEATWQALPRVLDLLDREGYRPVTVGDLLRAAAQQKN